MSIRPCSALRAALASLPLLVGLRGPAQQWQAIAETCSTQPGIGTAFDSSRGRMVAFDGFSVHEWDGAAWHIAGALPNAPSNNVSIAYDPLRQRTVLLRHDGTTWEWDGSSWTQASPAASPPPRTEATLAWDGVSQQVLAFGGVVVGPGTLLQETWVYDGTTWTQPPAAARPSPRRAVSMNWDSARQRVVLFGGSTNSGFLDETWEWDGTTWLQYFPAAQPTPRDRTQLSFDAARQRTVLFGGGGQAGERDDTWEWDGGQWTQAAVAPHPSRRARHGQAFDPTRGTTLVWGGTDQNGQALGDMWEWNGSAWSPLPSATGPSAVAGAATDLTLARLVTLGRGSSPNAVWLWDGRSWLRIDRPVVPIFRWRVPMAYDLARHRTVLFGGLNEQNQLLADTWEWDGFSWVDRAPPVAPAPRSGHALAYQLSPPGVLLFGGQGLNGLPRSDTWLWNGISWTDVTPIVGFVPPARFGHGMATTPNSVCLFGGWDGITVFDDTWSWNGTWSPRSPATVPPGRHRHGMTTEANGSTVRIAGGIDAAGLDLGDSWTYDGVNWSPGPSLTRPQHDLTLALDPLRTQPLAVAGQAAGQPAFRVGLELLTTTPSQVVAYGQGCPGSLGVPALRAGSRPCTGSTTFRLHVGEVPASALTAILIDAAAASTPLGGGCTQLIATPFTFAVGLANGAQYFGATVPIPAGNALLGAVFFVQGAALDPSGALAGVASLTGGLELHLGQ